MTTEDDVKVFYNYLATDKSAWYYHYYAGNDNQRIDGDHYVVEIRSGGKTSVKKNGKPIGDIFYSGNSSDDPPYVMPREALSTLGISIIDEDGICRHGVKNHHNGEPRNICLLCNLGLAE